MSLHASASITVLQLSMMLLHTFSKMNGGCSCAYAYGHSVFITYNIIPDDIIYICVFLQKIAYFIQSCWASILKALKISCDIKHLLRHQEGDQALSSIIH
jgi:hypothetical protein